MAPKPKTKPKSPRNGRMRPSAMLASGTAGAVVAWAWNGAVPSYPMPPEVAAASTPLVGEVLGYAIKWLPRP